MTKAEEETRSPANIMKENSALQEQVSYLQELISLRDESFFRQQLLIQLNRIAMALEKQANYLTKEEDSLEEDKVISPPKRDAFAYDEDEEPEQKPKSKLRGKW